ncbi:MAG: hypothetical protein WC655_27755 [Candidatus Hydrogenedentales bacterium]|jgi:hypothetical protein
MTEPTLPALPTLEGDNVGLCFGWHALNYRTAHHLHAQEMWEALERFTQAWGQQCFAAGVAMERARAAKIAAPLSELAAMLDEAGSPYYDGCDLDLQWRRKAQELLAAIRKG